jgi:asparagine synthase (glutamine-hydrolysing)
LAGRFAQLLNHRGPDEWGYYYSTDGGALLVNTRLAVVGLSNGRQPLSDERRRVWLVGNGEIYNNVQLKRELEGHGVRFRSDSDMEVVVHLFAREGLACLQRLRGEFALALWDEPARRLHLVRDRFGIKPLVYCHHQGALSFGSEAKCLFACGDIPREFDPGAITHILAAFFFDNLTPFSKISALRPGHVATYFGDRDELRIHSYWDLDFRGVEQQGPGDTDAIDSFADLIEETVDVRMRSDVPVGTYLSGGLDSSLTTALAAARAREHPVTAYTVAFPGDSSDEWTQAKALRDQLQIDGYHVAVGAGDLAPDFLRSIWHSEIPIVNTHGVAKMQLSRLTRQHGKVVLTGEGADELLCGYRSFEHLALLQQTREGALPLRRLRQFVAAYPRDVAPFLNLVNESETIARLGAYPYSLLRHEVVRQRIPRALSPFYRRALDDYDPIAAMLAHLDQSRLQGLRPIEATQYVLFKTDLPSYLLNFLGDRQEMANSVEGRLPFLDHVLVEQAMRLATNAKLRHGKGKWLLRQAAKRWLPEHHSEREKQPFFAPASRSLDLKRRGRHLRALLRPAKLQQVGIFRPFSGPMAAWISELAPGTLPLAVGANALLAWALSFSALHELFIERFWDHVEEFCPPLVDDDRLMEADVANFRPAAARGL